MKRFFYLMLLVASFSFLPFTTIHASLIGGIKIAKGVKEQKTITLNCTQKGVKVFLNGEEICSNAPGTATIEVVDYIPMEKKLMKTVIRNFDKMSQDWIQSNTLVFQFVKKGYESKSVIVKPKLEFIADKKSGVSGLLGKKDYGVDFIWPDAVFCELERDHAYVADPTIVDGGADERVSRDNAGETSLERTILRWTIDSDPRGARIFYRVISSVPSEVKNTNENYLTTTPYEETRSFNILGLTYANSRDVTIEFKISKRGYEDQIKRFNVRQAIDQQEINAFFELVPKEE